MPEYNTAFEEGVVDLINVARLSGENYEYADIAGFSDPPFVENENRKAHHKSDKGNEDRQRIIDNFK